MGLGPEWIGVIGTSVGGVLGVLGTLGSQAIAARSAKSERLDQTKRDDHLRYIDERKALYSEWISAARQAHQYFSSVQSYRTRAAETGDESGPSSAESEATTQCLVALIDLREATAAIELLAADSVRNSAREHTDQLIRMFAYQETTQLPEVAPTVERMREDLRILNAQAPVGG